jgi:hypothetical protein
LIEEFRAVKYRVSAKWVCQIQGVCKVGLIGHALEILPFKEFIT